MAELELDPREIQRAIRALEHADLDVLSISEIEALLTPLFKGYAVAAPRYQPGVYLYRARKCSKPVRLAELSYPPPQAVASIGRANDIGESIFYGATARAVPFFEIDVQPGDTIALSRWKTTKPMLLNHIGFSAGTEAFVASERRIEEIYDFVARTRGHNQLNALVHDYLAETFARNVPAEETRRYKLTVAIA